MQNLEMLKKKVGFVFVCVKGIPLFWIILGLFGYSLLGLGRMPVYEGKRDLEHCL